jgi:hypothetical protein
MENLRLRLDNFDVRMAKLGRDIELLGEPI